MGEDESTSTEKGQLNCLGEDHETWLKNDFSNDVVLLQLSFIQHSLINPEIFCFADYPCHTVATDILKAPPEDDNREIATW